MAVAKGTSFHLLTSIFNFMVVLTPSRVGFDVASFALAVFASFGLNNAGTPKAMYPVSRYV